MGTSSTVGAGSSHDGRFGCGSDALHPRFTARFLRPIVSWRRPRRLFEFGPQVGGERRVGVVDVVADLGGRSGPDDD